jgi:hypothetical protein
VISLHEKSIAVSILCQSIHESLGFVIPRSNLFGTRNFSMANNRVQPGAEVPDMGIVSRRRFELVEPFQWL